MNDQDSFKTGTEVMDAVTKAINHIIQKNPDINRAAALSGVMVSAFNYVYALAPDQEIADKMINNSRQAAIKALQQMPDVARKKAGVALPHDSSEEKLTFLDANRLACKTQTNKSPDK